jgi:Spy/CpxP family protein refolding chaperone
VSPWKVILATLVIFTAGLFTGALGIRHFTPPEPKPAFKPTPDNPFLPWMVREQFVQFLAENINLTPEQKDKVLKIVHESQQRTRILTSLVEPEMREELRATRESIREVLTPEQREKYEEILKRRLKQRDMPRPNGGRPGPRPGRDIGD